MLHAVRDYARYVCGVVGGVVSSAANVGTSFLFGHVAPALELQIKKSLGLFHWLFGGAQPVSGADAPPGCAVSEKQLNELIDSYSAASVDALERGPVPPAPPGGASYAEESDNVPVGGLRGAPAAGGRPSSLSGSLSSYHTACADSAADAAASPAAGSDGLVGSFEALDVPAEGSRAASLSFCLTAVSDDDAAGLGAAAAGGSELSFEVMPDSQPPSALPSALASAARPVSEGGAFDRGDDEYDHSDDNDDDAGAGSGPGSLGSSFQVVDGLDNEEDNVPDAYRSALHLV